VFLFLHSWRSTVITGLTLPIALIVAWRVIRALRFPSSGDEYVDPEVVRDASVRREPTL